MISKLLRRLDAVTLRYLAGPVIVDAVQSAFPNQTERFLAEILMHKHGDRILEVSRLRVGLIDTLEGNTAQEQSRRLGLPGVSAFSARSELQSRFSRWDVRRSGEFLSIFNLPSEYGYRRIVDARQAVEHIDFDQNIKIEPRPFLHPYQGRIKLEMTERFDRPGSRFMVQMPTGSGKTYMALEVATDWIRRQRRDVFAVWIVESTELAEQAFLTFQKLWRAKGDRPLNLYRYFSGFSPDFPPQVGGLVFAGFDKIRAVWDGGDVEAKNNLRGLIDRTGLVIVDEAHMSVARTYQQTLDLFIARDRALIFGLTATPGRGNAAEVPELVQIYSGGLIPLTDESGAIVDGVSYLQKGGYLAEVVPEQLETGLTCTESDDESLRVSLARNAERNQKILNEIQKAEEAEESTLVFSCNLDHVYALFILCRARGIRAEVITGAVPGTERLRILDAFRAGEFRILINLDLLSTGIDIPNVNKLIITRPVVSPILYSQIMGRALRGPKNGGNLKNVIVTLRDNLRNFPNPDFLFNYFGQDWRRHT